jgi:hypothetical protein
MVFGFISSLECTIETTQDLTSSNATGEKLAETLKKAKIEAIIVAKRTKIKQ